MLTKINFHHHHTVLKCTNFCVNMFSILLGIYLGVEFGVIGDFMFNHLKTARHFLTMSSPFYHSVYALISLHPLWQLLQSVFLIIAMLMDMKEYLIVLLIYISLMTNDAEHFFMYLMAICVFSLEKCLFKSCTYFLSWAIRIFKE